MKKPHDFNACADRLKALADPDRLRIVDLLLEGNYNVGQISAALGQEMVNVSHHLGILRRHQIVVAEKRGRFVIYSLHPDVFIAPTGPQNELQLDLGCCQLNLESETE